MFVNVHFQAHTKRQPESICHFGVSAKGNADMTNGTFKSHTGVDHFDDRLDWRYVKAGMSYHAISWTDVFRIPLSFSPVAHYPCPLSSLCNTTVSDPGFHLEIYEHSLYEYMQSCCSIVLPFRMLQTAPTFCFSINVHSSLFVWNYGTYLPVVLKLCLCVLMYICSAKLTYKGFKWVKSVVLAM
jgi:hypothetical protein